MRRLANGAPRMKEHAQSRELLHTTRDRSRCGGLEASAYSCRLPGHVASHQEPRKVEVARDASSGACVEK